MRTQTNQNTCPGCDREHVSPQALEYLRLHPGVRVFCETCYTDPSRRQSSQIRKDSSPETG